MKQQIKNRYTSEVIFECDVPDDVNASGMAMRHALEKAIQAKANLSYADLRFADLRSANLRSADLSYANLRFANLRFANMRYADLSSANLRSANLRFANMRDADLSSANLRSADLSYADLRYADLSYADLRYANMRYANMRSANLRENNKLIGLRPFFSIGPIGSRADYLQSFITEKGVLINAGCFKEKTLDEFRDKLAKEHDQNDHAKEYEIAILMIEAHAAIWTPKETK